MFENKIGVKENILHTFVQTFERYSLIGWISYIKLNFESIGASQVDTLISVIGRVRRRSHTSHEIN